MKKEKFNMTTKRTLEVFTLLFGDIENVEISKEEVMNRLYIHYQYNDISLCELTETAFLLGK